MAKMFGQFEKLPYLCIRVSRKGDTNKFIDIFT